MYLATNRANGKQYVGVTSESLQARRQRHIGNGKKFAFQVALCKYGAASFVWNVLKDGLSKSEAFELEKHYVALLDTYGPQGYNRRPGGRGAPLEVSETTKAKLRRALVGRKKTKEECERIYTPAVREKISLSKRGRRRPQSAVLAISGVRSATKRPDVRAKISQSLRHAAERRLDVSLGREVRALLDAGLSQVAVAKQLGTCRKVVRRIQKGTHGWGALLG